MTWRALIATALIALSLAACGDGSEDPDSSPSPSPESSESPTSSPEESPSESSPTEATDSGPQTFKEFAVEIDQAIAKGSTEFFLENPILTDVECPNELITECGAGPTPTILQGVIQGHWRSEGFPVSPDELELTLSEYFATGPELVALARKDSEGATSTPAHYAIAAVAGDSESTAVFVYKEDSGDFRLQSLILAPVLGEEWTSGTCSECYDHWEAW